MNDHKSHELTLFKLIAVSRGQEMVKLQRRLHSCRVKLKEMSALNAKVLHQSKEIAHIAGPRLRSAEAQVELLQKTVELAEHIIGLRVQDWSLDMVRVKRPGE